MWQSALCDSHSKLNAKNSSCFYPVPQAADCINRAVERSTAPVVYLSTDAAESETGLLQLLLVVNGKKTRSQRRSSDLKNLQATTRSLELHVGKNQQAVNTRPQGGLPADTETSKQVMEITLRSGKELQGEPSKATTEVDIDMVTQQSMPKYTKYLRDVVEKKIDSCGYAACRRIHNILEEIIEDVLIKVDKFVVPAGFFVLNFMADEQDAFGAESDDILMLNKLENHGKDATRQGIKRGRTNT
ncbi:hypothetical protein FXO38_31072 [Capsicum annuum]|nr:hypothetical protein FXO38_31072 [Capsicum annuum]